MSAYKRVECKVDSKSVEACEFAFRLDTLHGFSTDCFFFRISDKPIPTRLDKGGTPEI